MKLLFLDTETTGVDPDKNGLIQVAGIIEIDGVVYEEFNFRVRPFPGQLVDSSAVQSNGITIDMMRTFPDQKPVYDQIMGVLNKYIRRYDKNDKFHLIGQNPAFDYEFLNAFLERFGEKYLYSYIYYHRLDLVMLTASFMMAGLIPKLPDLRLATVAKALGVPLEAHDAMNDIRATRTIYYRYLNFLMKAGKALGLIGTMTLHASLPPSPEKPLGGAVEAFSDAAGAQSTGGDTGGLEIKKDGEKEKQGGDTGAFV